MNTQWLSVSLSNKQINYSDLAIIKIACYHLPYCFYYLQNDDNIPVGTAAIMSDYIL